MGIKLDYSLTTYYKKKNLRKIPMILIVLLRGGEI